MQALAWNACTQTPLRPMLLLFTIVLMTLFAYRIGAFGELTHHQQLHAFHQLLLEDAEESEWETRMMVASERYGAHRRFVHMGVSSRTAHRYAGYGH
ncbi:MAG: hypothetical protein RhofKO_30640 [Rhodothermales bacterium]